MSDYTITEQDRDILKAIAAWQLLPGIEFKSIDGDWPMPKQSARRTFNAAPLLLAMAEFPCAFEAIRRVRNLEKFGHVTIDWTTPLPVPYFAGRPVDSVYTLPNGSAFAVRFVDDQAHIVQASKRRPRLTADSPDVLGWWRWSDGLETAAVTVKGFELLAVPAMAKAETLPSMEPMTEAEAAVLALIPVCKPGQSEGIQGKTIVEKLEGTATTIKLNHLQKNIMKKLRKTHGIKNRRGVGYYRPSPV